MMFASGQLFRAASKFPTSQVLTSLARSQAVWGTSKGSTPWMEHRDYSQLQAKHQLALKPNPALLQAFRSSGSGSHAGLFKVERIWAVGMLPLFPMAMFIHEPWMDYALTVAISLHLHWGMHVVMEDYARPFVLGKTLSKICVKSVYLLSILIFAGLLSFNLNDVGITKAFEMIWSL